MNRYLLDTNHLSAYLDGDGKIELKIASALRAGDRAGIRLPVLCEYHAGIRLGRHYQKNLKRLSAALCLFRLWPVDEETAGEFSQLYTELRTEGRMLSQFDLLIAALARQRNLTLLTADKDFSPVSRLRTENWLK